MHIAFIPYGKRELVETLLRDMEAQKHLLKMTKNGKEKSIWIDAQIRAMPLGIYEYVFPKEDESIVINTLKLNNPSPYGVGKAIAMLRKVLKYKKIPKVEEDKSFLWRREWVSIMPIGVRYDGEIVGNGEIDRGWTHEAI